MNEMYKIIESLCNKRGISITKMCKEAGISRAPLTELKKGRTQKLSVENSEKIASYFGVTVSYLLGTEKTASPEDDTVADYLEDLRRGEIRTLLEATRGLSKGEVEAMAEFMKQMKGDGAIDIH